MNTPTSTPQTDSNLHTRSLGVSAALQTAAIVFLLFAPRSIPVEHRLGITILVLGIGLSILALGNMRLLKSKKHKWVVGVPVTTFVISALLLAITGWNMTF